MDRYLPKDALSVGQWYKVKARSFSEACWDGDGFVGERTKFGDTFMFKEYHWDDGPPFGTVKPLEEIDG